MGSATILLVSLIGAVVLIVIVRNFHLLLKIIEIAEDEQERF